MLSKACSTASIEFSSDFMWAFILAIAVFSSVVSQSESDARWLAIEAADLNWSKISMLRLSEYGAKAATKSGMYLMVILQSG